MAKCTLQNRILRHLKDFGSITSWEAIKFYGATRLSAIIYNLNKQYIIEGVFEHSMNRYGDFVKYKRYYLKGIRNGKNSCTKCQN